MKLDQFFQSRGMTADQVNSCLANVDAIQKLEDTTSAATQQYNVQGTPTRSEEHTSELHSLMRISYAVFCLQTKTGPPPTHQPLPPLHHILFGAPHHTKQAHAHAFKPPANNDLVILDTP